MDAKMMKQLQQMQQKMLKAQEDLANEIVTGTAGGGAVTVQMNGHHELRGVKIDPDAVDPGDIEMLEDMVLTAFNDALEKAREVAQEKLGAVTGGMNIPGMF
jgi:DNA-binding YbaB/EbfC family protein